MSAITVQEARLALDVLTNSQAAPQVSLLADPRKIIEAHTAYHSLLGKLRDIVEGRAEDANTKASGQ